MRFLLVLLALCHSAIGQDGEELRRLEAKLAAAPTSIPLLSAAGDAHLFLGEYHLAVERFEKMIALDPALDAPHWRLGIAYFFDRQWAKSSQQFAKYHAYDGRDRENGLWKFLGDFQLHGLEKARAEMLPYTEFDREPFPSLYDLYAGKLTPEQFTAALGTRNLRTQPRVMFNALYYSALLEHLQGQPAPALAKLREAVALFTPETAGSGGPGYMWRVARIHLQWLSTPQP